MDDQAIEDRVGLRNMPHYASLLFNMGMLYGKKGKRGKAWRYHRNARPFLFD